jgi:hypothetical protein
VGLFDVLLLLLAENREHDVVRLPRWDQQAFDDLVSAVLDRPLTGEAVTGDRGCLDEDDPCSRLTSRSAKRLNASSWSERLGPRGGDRPHFVQRLGDR